MFQINEHGLRSSDIFINQGTLPSDISTSIEYRMYHIQQSLYVARLHSIASITANRNTRFNQSSDNFDVM